MTEQQPQLGQTHQTRNNRRSGSSIFCGAATELYTRGLQQIQARGERADARDRAIADAEEKKAGRPFGSYKYGMPIQEFAVTRAWSNALRSICRM